MDQLKALFGGQLPDAVLGQVLTIAGGDANKAAQILLSAMANAESKPKGKAKAANHEELEYKAHAGTLLEVHGSHTGGSCGYCKQEGKSVR